MKANKKFNQAGFTLIETLMAIAIFTIGILGLFGMQTAVIKQNLTANTITAGSTWATDQVEALLGLPYLHPLLGDAEGQPIGNGQRLVDCAVFNDENTAITSAEDNEYFMRSSDVFNVPPFYTVYWNVSLNCIMNTIPNSSPARDEQKPKYIQIIVQKQARDAPSELEHQHGGDHIVAVFHYIKQNTRRN